jgi:hypothetical protein
MRRFLDGGRGNRGASDREQLSLRRRVPQTRQPEKTEIAANPRAALFVSSCEDQQSAALGCRSSGSSCGVPNLNGFVAPGMDVRSAQRVDAFGIQLYGPPVRPSADIVECGPRPPARPHHVCSSEPVRPPSALAGLATRPIAVTRGSGRGRRSRRAPRRCARRKARPARPRPPHAHAPVRT